MQKGRVYKKGTNWMLQYWQPVIENGIQTKKRVAKKLGPIKKFRTKKQVTAQAQLILAPINAKTATPESTDTVLSFLEHKYLPYCERELRPSTYYIEMDPGVANREGSRLADDVAKSDLIVLSSVWDKWDEPNDSRKVGSDRPNQVLHRLFEQKRDYGGLYQLWVRRR